MSNKRYAIILAAGLGIRMQSKLPKVLHKVAGKPMVKYVLEQVLNLNPEKVVTIIGNGGEEVKEQLGRASGYAFQKAQLGSGHAALQAREQLLGKRAQTLVAAGDTPLLTSSTLEKLFKAHTKENAAATILTAETHDATGFGRIVRESTSGEIEKIVEQKDATEDEKKIKEINTSTYIFDNELLFSALSELNTENAQGEYYLTDVIEILKNQGKKIAALKLPDFSEALGINDRVTLALANHVMFKRNNERHLRGGVSLLDPETTYIESDVEIGQDTFIEGNVSIKGKTKIGTNVFLGSGTEIVDSILEDDTRVTHSVIEKSILRRGSDAGPFAHLRPKTELGKDVHVGNFVEIKAARLGAGTKVGHLTYVGNAEIGKEVNLGAGVIFVNYDGQNKFSSTIEDYAFIGSNANLVAPVNIGKNAIVAAGSTITESVQEDSLALARARQTNKVGHAQRYNHYHDEQRGLYEGENI